MNYNKIQWICVAIFILLPIVSTQHPQAHHPPTPNQKIKQLLDLKDENMAVIQDGTTALKDLTQQHQQQVNEKISQVVNVIKEAANSTQDIFPSLSAFLMSTLSTINDYKKEAAGGIAGLITAFQMIFGGGVSYLTSKMKNLSKHKQLIEQGFDLQFRMFQKQEMKVLQKTDPSPSFKMLFDYLDHRSKKLVKVVIGTSGMGFTTNLQEWVKRQNERDRYHRCIYYDMSEPPIRYNSAQENTHMDCISAIVYSLLHREDRNLILSIFKGMASNAFEFLMSIFNAVVNNPILAIAYLSSFFYLRQIFYLVTLYFIIYNLVLPVLFTFLLWLGNLQSTIQRIITNKVSKSRTISLKIVIDNFQVLQSEFEERFKASKLKNVINGMENSGKSKLMTTDNSTYEQHKELFQQSLTSLINNIIALQRSNDTSQEAQIIIFIQNSQFYSDYMENLRLSTPNPFKVRRLSQLPIKDILHILKCRTLPSVKIRVKRPIKEQKMNFWSRCIQSLLSFVGIIKQEQNSKQDSKQDSKEKVKSQEYSTTGEVEGIQLTKFFALFHNNSKVVTRMLNDVNLDAIHCRQNGSPRVKDSQGKLADYRTRQQNIAKIMRISISLILVHAQHLEQLASIQTDKSTYTQQAIKNNKEMPLGENLSEDSYLRYIGLFLGCIHKQLLFFASRSQGPNDPTFQSVYEELINIINDPENLSLDMLSTMSPENRHYLFQKQRGIISLKPDAEIMMAKWDSLIEYIRGDNNWKDSLREDFIYYYTENRILMENQRNKNHQVLHNQLNQWLKRPDQANLKVEQQKIPLTLKKSMSIMSAMNEHAFSRPDDELTPPDNEHTIKKQKFDAQGRKIFQEIVNFLTQRNIISEHIFFSRSMALGNYYLQQKVKQRVLYQKFQMNKCQLAKTIEIIANFHQSNEKKHAFIHEFARDTKQKLELYIKHEADSFEQGMAWLKCYYPIIPNCEIANPVIQLSNKYLLRRTNNCYVLKPHINDVLLYWQAFYPKLKLQKLQNQLIQNKIVSSNAQLKDNVDFLRSSTTICAHWIFQCKKHEKMITGKLLGCQIKDLSIVVERLQLLQCEVFKRKIILLMKDKKEDKKLKPLLSQVYHYFLVAFGLGPSNIGMEGREGNEATMVLMNLKESLSSIISESVIEKKVKQIDFDDVNELLFEYRQLLKNYHPDGLFKEISNKYHTCLYLYQHRRRYILSQTFRHILIAFHYVRKVFLNNQPIDSPINQQHQKSQAVKIEIGVVDELSNQLAFTKKQFIQFYRELKKQEWVLLMKYGQRVKRNIQQLLKGEKSRIRLNLIEATLLIDLKAQIAAFCFTS